MNIDEVQRYLKSNKIFPQKRIDTALKRIEKIKGIIVDDSNDKDVKIKKIIRKTKSKTKSDTIIMDEI